MTDSDERLDLVSDKIDAAERAAGSLAEHDVTGPDAVEEDTTGKNLTGRDRAGREINKPDATGQEATGQPSAGPATDTDISESEPGANPEPVNDSGTHT
jgi:hypothetical protein